jgi:Domain of unknown function (DUF4062)
MPYQATVHRVVIASPADVAAERREVQQLVFSWNNYFSQVTGVVLLPVMWETHATARMGDRPQALNIRQLVDDSDILIGILWTRLGTPTGRSASGTVEEIRRFMCQKKPALLYFSTASVHPRELDLEQYRKLAEFKQVCRRQGIVVDYEAVDELRALVHQHLLATVRRLTPSDAGEPQRAGLG